MALEKEESTFKLKLIDHPNEFQGHVAFFIARGREHYSAAVKLMLLPALDADGLPLKGKDDRIIQPFEYLVSALILFQFSFELLLKSLIKLAGKIPPSSGKKGHDLIILWEMASVDFKALSSNQKNDLEILKELSSIREPKKGKGDLTLMDLKYGKSAVSLSESPIKLLESFLRTYRLIDGELHAFLSQSPKSSQNV